MDELEIEHLPIDQLKPNKRNARLHSKKQVYQIAASIREFGFVNPVLIDKNSIILAGHGRVEAAKVIGIASVPVLRIEHLTEEQKRAFALADNKIALNAGWDMEMLAMDLRELSTSNLKFDLEITGFETAEIDFLIDKAPVPDDNDLSDSVPDPQETAISCLGDVWVLGDHMLACADSRDPSSYAELMNGDKARVVFADAPYNVPIDGHVGGLGSVTHREFAMASGEMTPSEFTKFLGDIFTAMGTVSTDGAIHFICMDWRHIAEVMAAGSATYSELKNVCVWNKNNGGMGSFYRSKHEFIFVYKVGTAPHLNTIELGKSGRYRTNVWDYAGLNTWRSGRDEALEMHPTVKPTALVIDAIKDCSRRNDIVLDPFSGSGTTIIAAQKCGRRARAIDIDPIYVDVAIRRWQSFMGSSAILAATGETFMEVEDRRNDPLQ